MPMSDSEGEGKTTYVLGWDGLDYGLCEEFGLTDGFAPHNRRADTLDNEVLGHPDTYEIWPSIITGKHPSEHGVRLVSDTGGAGAENPVVDLATDALHRYVSTRNRVRIAIALRNRGFRLEQKEASWYRRNGVSTVFDDRRSRVVGVPNYRTDDDEGLELMDGWGEKSSYFLEIEADRDDELVYYRPAVSLDRLEEWLVSEASSKLSIARLAGERGLDLVFVWFAYLDTVAHTEPVTGRDYLERAYRRAVEMTDEVRRGMDDDDTLIVMSDHGNRMSTHNHDAYFGSTDPDALEGVEDVFDYRRAIERVTPEDDGDYEIRVRSGD